MSRQLKECSAKVYEGIIGDVIGESLHPGGVDLTAKVAEVAKINNASTVLDLASGKGASVRFMAENFGCNVIGMDLSSRLIKTFKRNSVKSFLGETAFVVGDGEFMPYVDSCFDVVMCECAFNLFPDKKGVLSEISRVLKDGGRFLLTDIVLRRSLPTDLKTELTFALCIAGAETLGGLYELLEQAGFVNMYVEDHSDKLISLGLKLLFSDLSRDASTLSVKDQEVLGKLFDEDLLNYALIAAYKPTLQKEE